MELAVSSWAWDSLVYQFPLGGYSLAKSMSLRVNPTVTWRETTCHSFCRCGQHTSLHEIAGEKHGFY
jgi:hypothetical protein